MLTTKDSNAIAYQQEEPQGKGRLYERATIDALPDDVLLDVFNFYLDHPRQRLDAWHKLVHVCRRWRQVVFGSPRRLNLRILCTGEPVNIWPALPIVIRCFWKCLRLMAITNICAALEHNDRVCEIVFDRVPSPLLERFASIKKRFPALTSLELQVYDDTAPVLPDSFLGGSAPRLRHLGLGRIPFPGLPKLLMSANDLATLSVCEIPDSGYISPEAMVTCLSSLTKLHSLVLEFRSPRSHPYQTNRHWPPLTRTVLPSLISLRFQGDSEYLEDIVARIDVSRLKLACIMFFNQLTFDTPLLRRFISRTEAFKASHRAEILFTYDHVILTFSPEEGYRVELRLGILCKPSDGQLSSLARVCNSSLPPLTTLEYLDISVCRPGPHLQDDIGSLQWLELFHPFITVKSLQLNGTVALHVALSLQELVGERVMDVLPALQNIFVQGPVQQGIVQFITARQLVGHPVAVQYRW